MGMGCSFPKHFSDIEKIDEGVQRGIVSCNICNDFWGGARSCVIKMPSFNLGESLSPVLTSPNCQSLTAKRGPKREKEKIPKQYPK
jgi:hypothetical protein